MRLRNKKKQAIIAWFNSLDVNPPIDNLKELANGEHFLRLRNKIDPAEATVGETAKENYELIQQFLNDYFQTHVEYLVDFKSCMKAVVLEIAKLSVLLLSAVVQKSLPFERSNLSGLLQLDEDIQEEIKDCMSAVILSNESNESILSPNFANILFEQSSPTETPQRTKSSGKLIKKPRNLSNSVTSSPSSPLMVFWDSPRIAQQVKVKKLEKEVSELKKQLHKEEEISIDLEGRNKLNVEKLNEKDKEILQLKKTVEHLKVVEEKSYDANELHSTCETHQAEIENLKLNLNNAAYLQAEVIQLKLEIEELLTFKRETEQKAERLNKIESENQKESVELMAFQNSSLKELEVMKSENANLRQALDETQNQCAIYETLYNEFKEESSRKLQNSPELPPGEPMDFILNSDKQELEDQVNHLKNENTILEQNVSSLTTKVADLEKNLREQEMAFSLQKKNLTQNCEALNKKLKLGDVKNLELQNEVVMKSDNLISVNVELLELQKHVENQASDIKKLHVDIKKKEKEAATLINKNLAYQENINTYILQIDRIKSELRASAKSIREKTDAVQCLENELSLKSKDINFKTNELRDIKEKLDNMTDGYNSLDSSWSKNVKQLEERFKRENDLVKQLQMVISNLENEGEDLRKKYDNSTNIIKEMQVKEQQQYRSYNEEKQKFESLIEKQAEELKIKQEAVVQNSGMNESITLQNKKLEEENHRMNESINFLRNVQLERDNLSLQLEQVEANLNSKDCDLHISARKLEEAEELLMAARNKSESLENSLDKSNEIRGVLRENVTDLTNEKNCLLQNNEELRLQIESLSNLKCLQDRERENFFAEQVLNVKEDFEGKIKKLEVDKLKFQSESNSKICDLQAEVERVKVEYNSKMESAYAEMNSYKSSCDNLKQSYFEILNNWTEKEEEMDKLKVVIEEMTENGQISDVKIQELIDSLRDADREFTVEKEKNKRIEREYSLCVEQRDNTIEELQEEIREFQKNAQIMEQKDKEIESLYEKLEISEDKATKIETQNTEELRRLQNILEVIKMDCLHSDVTSDSGERDCLTLHELVTAFESMKSDMLAIEKKYVLQDLSKDIPEKTSKTCDDNLNEVEELPNIIQDNEENRTELLLAAEKLEILQKEYSTLSLTLKECLKENEELKNEQSMNVENKMHVQELVEQVSSLEDGYFAMQEKSNKEIEKVKITLNDSEEKNTKLYTELLSCRAIIEENVKKISLLNSQLVELNKEKEKWTADFQHSENIFKTTQENTKKDYETEKIKMQNIIKDLTDENEGLIAEKNSIQERLCMQECNNCELTAQLEELDNKNKRLRAVYQENKKIFQEIKQLQDKVVTSGVKEKEVRNILSAENMKLNKMLSSTKNALLSTEKERSEMENKLLSTNQKVLKLQSLIDSYKASLASKQNQLKLTQSKYETALESNEKMKGKIAQLESLNQKYKQQIACFNERAVKKRIPTEDQCVSLRRFSSQPESFSEMNSHLCTPHKKSAGMGEDDHYKHPTLNIRIDHAECHNTNYLLNSTRSSFQDITEQSAAELNITPSGGGRGFLGSRFLPLDDEEDFLNHSSLADLKPGTLYLPAPSSTRRLSELQRRNTLCPPHLQTSYPVETQMHSVRKYTDSALKAGRAVEDKGNCESFLGESSKASEKLSPKRKRSNSDEMNPGKIKKASKKNSLIGVIKGISSPIPLRYQLRNTPRDLKQLFSSRKGLQSSTEKVKLKKGSRL